MISDRPLESNPYLKARGEVQLRAKHAFDRSVGWRFGLALGVLIVVPAYGWDAAQLAIAHAEFWWLRLALALVTIIPLATVMGALAGYLNWLLKAFVWALFGVVAIWWAHFIPFRGAQFVLQLLNPDFRVVPFLALPATITDSLGFIIVPGAALGVVAGLVHTLIANWTWERTGDDYGVGLGSWVLFFLSLPVALAFAYVVDSALDAQLRAPLQYANAIIQSGLNDAPNLDSREMDVSRGLIYQAGQRWRTQLSPDYTLHLAAVDVYNGQVSFVDASFSGGLMLRCRIAAAGETAGVCDDLAAAYRAVTSSFSARGIFNCSGCEARIEPEAALWQAQNGRALTPSDTLTLKHGAGSAVTARVQSPRGEGFQCLFWGVNPVVIENCK